MHAKIWRWNKNYFVSKRTKSHLYGPYHGFSPWKTHFMWDLWLTKWHWGVIFSEFFGIPLPIIISPMPQTHVSPPLKGVIGPTTQQGIITFILSCGFPSDPAPGKTHKTVRKALTSLFIWFISLQLRCIHDHKEFYSSQANGRLMNIKLTAVTTMHSPNTLSCRGAQLDHRGNFTLNHNGSRSYWNDVC